MPSVDAGSEPQRCEYEPRKKWKVVAILFSVLKG